jgi:hypothetical protein
MDKTLKKQSEHYLVVNSCCFEQSKTLGIDKNKLCNCLVKLIQHSQVTALLIVYFDARKGSRDSILTLLFDFLQKVSSSFTP